MSTFPQTDNHSWSCRTSILEGVTESQRACEGPCGFDNERKKETKRRLWQDAKTVERHEFESGNTELEHVMCRHCEESTVSDKSVHQQ